VLLGVIDEGSNLALKVLQSLDIEIDDLRGELTASMGPPTDEPQGHIPFTPLAKRVLELTAKESMALGHNYIGCEHIVLGLVADEEGMGGKVLRRMGVELRTTRRAVVTALSGYVHAQQPPPSSETSTSATSTSAAPADALAEIRDRLDAIERRLQS
jgi:ATP-dependent Clp protease ATP-binding subunit ClpC